MQAPISVWPLPQTLFMAGRYCHHDLSYYKEEGDDDKIIMGKDDLESDMVNCVSTKCVDDFSKVHEKIQQVGAQLQNGMVYQPLVRELCTVEIDEEWYRCMLVGRLIDKILVYTVDYGVVCAVSESNIRVSGNISHLTLLSFFAAHCSRN